MANYLALIRKLDFADLYRYGSIHVNVDHVIEVEGSVDTIRSNNEYCDSIFRFSNPFESTFTYLIVHFEKTSLCERPCDIDIEDVLNLFPLDLEAKSLLEEDFGPTIRFDNPLWPDAVESLKITRKVSDCKKGVVNLWKIFNLDEESSCECRNVLSEDIIKDVVKRKLCNVRPSGDLPVWVYLLMYERHSMYPNTMLGCYMDAVHSAINYKGKLEYLSIESSRIFSYLDSIDINIQSKFLFETVRNAPETQAFISFAQTIVCDYDYITVATLFFKLKSLYRDCFKYDSKLIDSCKKCWPKEFALAAYLLGWVLGYDKTYEELYKMLPLKISSAKFVKCNAPEDVSSEQVDDSSGSSCCKTESLLSTQSVSENVEGAKVPLENTSKLSEQGEKWSNDKTDQTRLSEDKVLHTENSGLLFPKDDQDDGILSDSGVSFNPIEMVFLTKNGRESKDKRNQPNPRRVTSQSEKEELERKGWIIR